MNIDYKVILEDLESEMLETKRIWYENGKQEEWDKMWGLTGRHRYENARKKLKKASEMQERGE
jgi:hypothetical protein